VCLIENGLGPARLAKWHTILPNGGFCVYNKSMNKSDFNEFYPQLSQKGYTLNEVRSDSKTVTREVPLAFRDRYNTYAEYESAIHDYMNGL